MTAGELKAIIKVLKDSGVTYYKTKSLELHLSPPVVKPIEVRTGNFTNVIKQSEQKPEPVAVDAPEPLPEKIEHHVQELSSLLKLNDTDLLDRLFPDHINESEVEQ